MGQAKDFSGLVLGSCLGVTISEASNIASDALLQVLGKLVEKTFFGCGSGGGLSVVVSAVSAVTVNCHLKSFIQIGFSVKTESEVSFLVDSCGLGVSISADSTIACNALL